MSLLKKTKKCAMKLTNRMRFVKVKKNSILSNRWYTRVPIKEVKTLIRGLTI